MAADCKTNDYPLNSTSLVIGIDLFPTGSVFFAAAACSNLAVWLSGGINQSPGLDRIVLIDWLVG